MRLRNIPGAREKIAENEWSIKEPEQYKGKWNEVFGNDNPIRIEVGMGKGRFIMTLAQMNPDVNYIGIEKYSSVMLRGLQKQEELQLPNIRFIRMEAEVLTEVFGKG
jgi:tRNA (guanine-N7-)-methyltransferase